MKVELLASIGRSLLLTLVFEVSFFLLLAKKNKKDLLLLILVNILTNPALVLLYWLIVLYSNFNSFLSIIILELSAILVESFYYRRYGEEFHHPFIFSIAANTFSFGLGLLIKRFI